MNSGKEISKGDNLIIQSYSVISLLLSLSNAKFLESNYYKNKIESKDEIMKRVFEDTKEIDGQGAMLISFYTLLVIPKELLAKELDELNEVISNIKDINYVTSYSNEKENKRKNYVRHMRNAISHCNIEFDPQKNVYFKDENTKTKECCCLKIPLKSIGEILSKLQNIIYKYLKEKYTNE